MEAKILTFVQAQWPLLLAAVALIIMIFKGPLTRKAAGISEVDAKTAVQLINHEEAVVIDVREQNEWAQGHLPGARHIPLGDLPKYMKDLEKHRGHHVICQCASGMRSARAAASLKKAGFDKIYSLKGGIGAWRGAGLPVEK
ncbi:rhodanese-like domain-containing protein [Acidithiobacillus concretivorus]|uniref:Rhodanese-like domain-containing protein n=1 Tax=Acidithiobacillus concretivorus TaxID=3063952 RepID=A0ABS5ZPW4_9PROT|nr:rhodanese-like domain-containing protein [Acidithiobacillus concretivorus]MBU2738655.1 rhodanese-like domain-containing protein [Acidithiobacillus concretivorus]